jgi:hypothetical protein
MAVGLCRVDLENHFKAPVTKLLQSFASFTIELAVFFPSPALFSERRLRERSPLLFVANTQNLWMQRLHARDLSLRASEHKASYEGVQTHPSSVFPIGLQTAASQEVAVSSSARRGLHCLSLP